MSYENTPMKIQWREIDGRQVPFVLPQYWDTLKKDWVVTSEQDRLPVDARLTGSIVEELISGGKGLKQYNFRGDLDSGEQKDIIPSTNDPLSISFLEFYSDNRDAVLDIFTRDSEGNGETIRTVNTSSGFLDALTPNNISNYRTPIFRVIEFDESRNRFKFGMENHLSFPTGTRIRVRNRTDDKINISINVIVREVS